MVAFWSCFGHKHCQNANPTHSVIRTLRCKDDISITSCPGKCDCWISTCDRSILVDCVNKALEEVPIIMPGAISVLHIERNKIGSLRNLDANSYFLNLSRLYFGQNKLQEIPDDLVPALIKLNELSLSDNLLSAIPYGFRNMNHTKLSIGGNILKCDCHAKWLLNWIPSYQHNIKDVNDIFCDSGEQLMLKNPDDFICRLSLEEIALIAMAATFAVFILGTILVYKNRIEIKVYLYTRFNWHPFDKPDEKDVLDVCI